MITTNYSMAITNISISNGTLTPSFSSSIYVYNVFIPVGPGDDTVNITVTCNTVGDVITYATITRTSGVPFSVNLNAGLKDVLITINYSSFYYIYFYRTYSIPYVGLLTPPQIAVAYNLPLPTANTGRGYKIGIINFEDDFLQSDLNSSFADLVAAGLLPLGTVAPTIIRSNPGNRTLNINSSAIPTRQVYCIAAMVPGASITSYQLQSSGFTNDEQYAELAARIIADGMDAVSFGYAWFGPTDNAFFAALDAAKIPFFYAVNSFGSFDMDSNNIDYPSRISNSIAVGGTHLSLNGNTRAEETAEIYSTDLFFTYSTGFGSPGSVSASAALPSYQSGLYYTPYNTSTGVGSPTALTHRGVPDISAPMNGYVMYYQGHVVKLGNISASAALMAAFIIRIMELTGVRKSSTEWNEFFYSHSNTFDDVVTDNVAVTGNNATQQADGYAVTVGWDLVTGLGAPNGLRMVNALTATTTGIPIVKETYNNAQATLQDILGIGDNGYGLPVINSTPVENTQVITAKQWNNLITDINVVHRHVTNINTSTLRVNTGTNIVTSATITALVSTVARLNTNRYTCHPAQFLNTGTSVATSTSTFFSDSTSTRTIIWGTGASTTISHEVLVSFPSRTLARYYFNIGSYLTFSPYYQGSILFDADAAWANFIDYLRAPARQYKYDRGKYVNYSSTTTLWTSGTLAVSVLAEKSVDERTIKFTTSYINSNPGITYITPTGSTYPTITL